MRGGQALRREVVTWPDELSGLHCRLKKYFLRGQSIGFIYLFLLRFLGGRCCPGEEAFSVDAATETAKLSFLLPSLYASPAACQLSLPQSQKVLGLGTGSPWGEDPAPSSNGHHPTSPRAAGASYLAGSPLPSPGGSVPAVPGPASLPGPPASGWDRQAGRQMARGSAHQSSFPRGEPELLPPVLGCGRECCGWGGGCGVETWLMCPSWGPCSGRRTRGVCANADTDEC